MRKFLILACWGAVLLVCWPAAAQEETGIVQDVIRKFEDSTEANAPRPPATIIQSPGGQITGTGGIPGIVDMGDNARLPALPEVPPTWESKPAVMLRALDKVTARALSFEIPVGDQFNFGALTIAVRACRARPPLEPADSAAFLQIVEQKPGEPMIPRFSGWMFSSSPSLSALEHPVYDVWVTGCGVEG